MITSPKFPQTSHITVVVFLKHLTSNLNSMAGLEVWFSGTVHANKLVGDSQKQPPQSLSEDPLESPCLTEGPEGRGAEHRSSARKVLCKPGNSKFSYCTCFGV